MYNLSLNAINLFVIRKCVRATFFNGNMQISSIFAFYLSGYLQDAHFLLVSKKEKLDLHSLDNVHERLLKK